MGRPGRFLMAEQLVTAGVRHVFGNPGTTEQQFMDVLHDYPQLQYVLALHEAVALGMADGYSRLSPVPAFVQLHITVGLGNAMGMLYNAWRTRAPMVIYAGQHPLAGGLQEPILSGDLVSMARPYTKWAVEVTRAAEIPMALRRAFKVAMDPPQGPVFLSIPADVMDEVAEASIAPLQPTYSWVPPQGEAVAKAAAILCQAQAPVIVAGDGALGAEEELTSLALLIGAPIYVAFGTRVPVSSDNPMYAGPLNVLSWNALRAQLGGADALLAVGCPLFPALSPLPASPLSPGCRIIHVDDAPDELGKTWLTEVPMLAAPKEALRVLREEVAKSITLQAGHRAQERVEALTKAKEEARRAAQETVPRSSKGQAMPPAHFAYELSQAVDRDSLLYDESVTVAGHLMRFLRLGPGQHLRAAGGGLGTGMGAPIGLKLAQPQRPVIAVVGDGAALYTIQALWTAAHYQIPVTWVIANNRSYRILKLNMLQYRGEAGKGRPFIAMDLIEPEVDFVALGQAFGVKGVRIEDPDELAPAVRQAQASREPWLLEVIIDGSVDGG